MTISLLQTMWHRSCYGTAFSLRNTCFSRSRISLLFSEASYKSIWNGMTIAFSNEQDQGNDLEVLEKANDVNPADRRADKRILVHIPVEITEINAAGHQFTERTFIEDVSDFGCRFSTKGTVQKGDTVAVKLLGPNGKSLPNESPKLFEVMWVAPKTTGLTVGARILQGEKLANAKFPPEHSAPQKPSK